MNKQSLLRRLDAIEQLLEDMRNEIRADDGPEEEIVQVKGQGGWDRGMLDELYPHIEGLPGVLALMDLIAERAPDEASYEEVKQRSGLDDRGQRNDHSALTRTTTRIFGRRTWPFAWRQAADGSMNYSMPMRMADWWRELRQGRVSG